MKISTSRGHLVTSTLIFLLLLNTSLSLSGQQKGTTQSSLSGQSFGLYLKGGALFRNHNDLSSLLYAKEDELQTGIYFSAAPEFRVKWNKLYFFMSGRRASFNSQPKEKEDLSVEESSASLSVGYCFTPIDNLEIIPHLGVLASETEILYTRTDSLSSTLSSYLNGPADSYRLLMERAYLLVGLSATYPLNIGNGSGLFPLNLGLDLAYQQAISRSRWKNVKEQSLEGTSIFENGFYAGISMGWWL